MEDDEWMKLPVEEKVVHKLWEVTVWIYLYLSLESINNINQLKLRLWHGRGKRELGGLLWRRSYSSHARQADSSLGRHFGRARVVMTWPFKISSVSAKMEEKTGGETQVPRRSAQRVGVFCWDHGVPDFRRLESLANDPWNKTSIYVQRSTKMRLIQDLLDCYGNENRNVG